VATRPDSLEVQGEFDLFAVSLPVFEGPFDLLLSLIARKKLDITEVALAQVTDEFIAFMKASPDLSRTTEFLVVAATLLDMKAAHLLPSVDEEDNAAEAGFLSRRRGRGRVLLMCDGDGLVGHDGSWCYGLFPLHSMPNLCEHVVGL